MIKLIVGSFFGFIVGMTYGIYQLVEVDGSKVVKIVKFIKAIVEVL